jgi:hypothetical protein
MATQFAACRFLALPLMKTHPNLMEFRLTHDAGQTQQQAVVVGKCAGGSMDRLASDNTA